jgi:hypothetical protein
MKTTVKNTVILSDRFIRSIEPSEKPQKFADSLGLYLYISPAGTKSWRYDYRIGGKRATITLGKFPEVTLSAARAKHFQARAQLGEGGHPAQEKKIRKLERLSEIANSFDAVSKSWYESKQERRSKIWRDTHTLYLKRDLSPVIGDLPLGEITTEILLAALEKTRIRSGIGTADRVRQTAVQVFDYGKRKLKVSSNVARSLIDWTDGAKPKKKIGLG